MSMIRTHLKGWSGAAIAALALSVFPAASQAADLGAANTPAADDSLIAQFYGVPATLPQSGLSATGTGTATAPADAGILYLNYYSNYNYPIAPAIPADPAATMPAAPMVPPMVTAAEMKPVIDALTAGGIAATDIIATADPNSSGSFRVRAKLAQPTAAKVQSLVTAANEAATKGGKFVTGGAQVLYQTNNCAAVENKARAAAIADLRSRATALASAAGVSLGNMTAISDSSVWGYSSLCPSASDAQVFQDAYPMNYSPMDLSVPAEVRMMSTISATYEMKR
jgi:hypothetical protein